MKKTTRSWRGRKTETRAHANRTFAKKRREWAIAYTSQCDLNCIDPSEFCPNGGKLPLVYNAQLRALFGDSVRVVRILGDLWFSPQTPAVATCGDLALPGLFNPTLMRIGLLKAEALQVLAGVTPAVNPMLGVGLPSAPGSYGDDYSEAKWMHQWTHSFNYLGDIGTELAGGGGCCSDVHTTSFPDNTFVDGTGTIGIETDCAPCEAPPVCALRATFKTPSPWHLHLDWKKPIVMRDDDDLGLYVGWEKLAPCGGARPTQDILGVWGGIRLLLEL